MLRSGDICEILLQLSLKGDEQKICQPGGQIIIDSRAWVWTDSLSLDFDPTASSDFMCMLSKAP
jgi:hypothetical protein